MVQVSAKNGFPSSDLLTGVQCDVYFITIASRACFHQFKKLNGGL
jgi:hypothetical protein